MCNLGETIARENIAKGLAKGRAEGLAKGRAEGIAETTLANIRNLMETTKWSIEQVMAALKIPESEQKMYADLITKQ